MATAKEIAQLGATLGREFSYELLQAVSPLDEDSVTAGAEAVSGGGAGLSARAAAAGDYLFKHALIQDTAYQSLLKSTRQQYHQQIAQVLEEQFPETVETQPELVAHHYTEAGLIAQAIPYWQQAGSEPVSARPMWKRSAHLTKGLELLKTLPDTPERTQQELTLQIALGAAADGHQGLCGPGSGKSLHPGAGAVSAGGRDPSALPGAVGTVAFYIVRAELQTARELAEQLLSLAQSVQDPALLLEAHYALGTTLFYLGELALARDAPGAGHCPL